MADTVHLFLTMNGIEIKGDCTTTSPERVDSIECLSFCDDVRTPYEWGVGSSTGRRTFEPIVIRKRIDKSSPMLAQALTDNTKGVGEFKFFRPNTSAGDGTIEHYFSVKIDGVNVVRVKRLSPDVIDPASAKEPPTEEVFFLFESIIWTYHPTGVQHEDRWDLNKG